MPYNSHVTGAIEPPAGGLGDLLEFLEGRRFVVSDDDGWLDHSASGWSTGFGVVDGVLQDISQGEAMKAYAFDVEFISALRAASKEGLIAYAFLTREGEDHDDTEAYEYVGGVWYTTLHLTFRVPLDKMCQISETIRHAAQEIIR